MKEIPKEMHDMIIKMTQRGVPDIRPVYRMAKIRYANEYGVELSEIPDIAETYLGNSLALPK